MSKNVCNTKKKSCEELILEKLQKYFPALTRIFLKCLNPRRTLRVGRELLPSIFSGKSKGGLSKGGLGPKGANWAKKGPFGAISALPPWVWGAEELVPISPEKAPTGPEKAPISPEKARFPRKDFPPIFSENLGLKPPFVSPRLDFPNFPRIFDKFSGLRIVGNGDQKKSKQNPPFFNGEFGGKFKEKIHKSFLESVQSKTAKDPEIKGSRIQPLKSLGQKGKNFEKQGIP